MKRIVYLFFSAFLFAAGTGWAGTLEPIDGRWEKGPAGEVVLTLDLPFERLAGLADKENKATSLSVADLADLIRERFHYLLRWQVGGEEIAPTSVTLPVPPGDGTWPDFLSLRVTWSGPNLAGGRVVTQSDSPDYTLALRVVEMDRQVAPAVSSSGGMRVTEFWKHVWFDAVRIGFVGVLTKGIEQICFVLVLYFSVRTVRELAWQLAVFTAACSLMLWLTVHDAGWLSGAGTPWIEAGLALSIAVATLRNGFNRQAPGHAWLVLVGCFGLAHGLGLARGLGEAHERETWTFSELAAVSLGSALGLLAAVAAAALLTGVWRKRFWYRSWIALPASVGISLGGLVWTWEHVQLMTKIPR